MGWPGNRDPGDQGWIDTGRCHAAPDRPARRVIPVLGGLFRPAGTWIASGVSLCSTAENSSMLIDEDGLTIAAAYVQADHIFHRLAAHTTAITRIGDPEHPLSFNGSAIT